MNQKTLDALTSSIYISRLTLNNQTIDDDDKRIRASGLYADWTLGNHAVGEIYNTYKEDGSIEQTWECYQAYDNSVYPDIIPGNSAWYTFNRPLHGKNKDTARPFVPVQGSHDIYKIGEFMIWTDGIIYECIAQNGTNFSPNDYPSGWKAVET